MNYLLLLLCCTSVAMAQMPNSAQPLPATDSTLRTNKASPQYDFYYSQKQAEQFVQLSNASYTLQDQIKKHRFRDKTYTKVVDKGVKVSEEFDDYILIGTGMMSEAKLNGEW